MLNIIASSEPYGGSSAGHPLPAQGTLMMVIATV